MKPKIKILQLCFFTNLWPDDFEVESWDIKNGRNVLDLPDNYGQQFDLVIAAPPCDQFTKANSHRWVMTPLYYIDVAQKCFNICLLSRGWVYENPPGRIEKLIPALSNYRVMTWHSSITNKETILYSNYLLLDTHKRRYGRRSVVNMSKSGREKWEPGLIACIIGSLFKELLPD